MSTISNPFVYLSMVKNLKQQKIEEQAMQHRSFNSIEAMDQNVKSFVIEYGLQIGDTALKVLEICCRHSLKVFGVSWLSIRSLAEYVQVSARTVQRAIKKLESINIIKRTQSFLNNGGHGTNLIVIQALESTNIDDRSPAAAGPFQPSVHRVQPAYDMASVMGGSTQNLESLNLLISNKEDLMIDRQHALTSVISNENDFPEIIESLLKHGKKIKANPTSQTSIMDVYMPRIYSMLINRYQRMLDPEIIEIACDQYIEKLYDLRGINPKFDILNPVAWFHDSYKDAIHIWKAKRYKKEI